MNTLIIYHREDNDGVFSAALSILGEYELFEEEYDGNMTPEIIGLTYGEVKQIIEGDEKAKIAKENLLSDYDRVVIVDINLGEDLMRELHAVYGANFIWCDHHGPILEALKNDNIEGSRNVDHSAIWQTWTYYQQAGAFVNRTFPQFLDYLQKWDSWTYTSDQKDEISDVNVGATATFELNVDKALEAVIELVGDYECTSSILSDCRKLGSVIRKENNRKNRELMERSADPSFTVGSENRKACCVLYSAGTGSYTFEAMKDINPEILHGIVLRRASSGTWSVSLYNIRNTPEFHCGAYLKEYYGGGGHEGAGGAEITEEQALNILKTKHI